MRDSDSRAENLLLSYLTPGQWEQYHAGRGFYAVGNKTGDLYLIQNRGLAIRIKDGHGFCLHGFSESGEELPRADILLVRKLLIECNEDMFLHVANDNNHIVYTISRVFSAIVGVAMLAAMTVMVISAIRFVLFMHHARL